MITLSKNGNAIRFTFVDNGHYLFNGTIEVPVNSLSLVTDESNMATFKKSATNDIFISATYDELGMTKSELETWYKDNMVGETGGGSSGVTPSEVQTMIDESISGLAESSAVTLEISEAVSGKADSDSLATVATSGSYNDLLDKPTIPDVSNYFDGAEYDSGTTRINFYHGSTVKAYIDASAFIVDGMIDDVRIDEISGVTYLVIDFNTDSGKEDIQIPLTDIFDPSNYYTKSEVDDAISAATDDMATKTWVGEQGYLTEHQSLSAYSTTEEVNSAIDEATSGKADTSAVTAVNDVLTAHTADTTIHVTSADKTAWDAKSDFSGSYNDLTDKPTIPTVPTNVSDFNNDAGYITSDAISGKVDTSTFNTYSGSVDTTLSGKQDTLSAGTGIDITNDTISVTGKVDTSTFNTYTAATATAIGDKLAVSDFNTYSGTVDTAINSKASQSDLSTLSGTVTAHTANTDIHVTTAQTAAWDAKSDFSGSYNDLTDKPTIPTVPTSNTAFTNDAGYITSDALSGYAESSAVTEEINAAVSGKVNTSSVVSAVTSASTDSQIPTAKAVYDAIPTGGTGGGKAIEAGRGISITTGETADTVSFNLPISAGTGSNSIIEGSNTTASSNNSHAEGFYTKTIGFSSCHAEGSHTTASGNISHAEGEWTEANGDSSHAEGTYTKATNKSEHASGQFNNSVSASATFGNSGNTLFSVGNGVSPNKRHNAFEIRQNGDIYITSGGTDIKLQDNLGGGSVSSAVTSAVTSASTDNEIPTAKAVYDAIPTGSSISIDSAITSGSTNAVEGGAIYDAVNAPEYPIEGALSAKHFLDDENMGCYTEIGDSTSIKVPNSTLLSYPYIAYAFASDSEFMDGGVGYVATVTSGVITDLQMLNGSSISSLTATYDGSYTYFTPSGGTFSGDNIGVIAVMGMDSEPMSFMDLRQTVIENGADVGIISVVGSISAETLVNRVNRIYDDVSRLETFNPIADTITLDDGDGVAGRNNDGVGYGVLNYNTYNPLTDTTTSGHTADVFKYSAIDFKSDDNVLTYNGSAISMDKLKNRGALATISAFTDGSSSTTDQWNFLFSFDTCFIINTNSKSSGGSNQQLSIDISGPNSKSGEIQLQLDGSNGLTVQVSYNEKYGYVSKTIKPFVLGNSYIIDTRKVGWGDDVGIHTLTVRNWQGSDFISSIKFYSTYDATIPIADIAADVAAGTYVTTTEMFDELSHLAREEEVNFYDYGSPSAITVSGSAIIRDFYGISISGMSTSGFYINVVIDDAAGTFVDGLRIDRDGNITSSNFPDEPIPYYLDDEITKIENGVWNIYLAEGTKASYLSINTTTEASAVIYKSFTETPIKDAVSNMQNSLSGYVATSAITSAVTSGDTNAVSSDAVYTAMGGLKLQQITQADYDALVSGGTVDASTLYIITNVVN